MQISAKKTKKEVEVPTTDVLGSWTEGGMSLRTLWRRFLVRSCLGKILCIFGLLFILSSAPGQHGEIYAHTRGHIFAGLVLIYASYRCKKKKSDEIISLRLSEQLETTAST